MKGDSKVWWLRGERRREEEVGVGAKRRARGDRRERADLETLRVMGLWLGVLRVGVLKGLPGGDFWVGVEGRAISSSNNCRSSASATSTSIPGGQFSLSVASTYATSASLFKGRTSVAICTTFAIISPKTFGDPTFLGDGKSNLLVEPIGSSSTSMGLC